MNRSSVDLALALRSLSIHRMNVARKIRRLQKREEKNLKTLHEQSQLESYLLLISVNVYQIRKAFQGIAKIEKRIAKHRQYEMQINDRLPGRNRGGFPRRQ